MTIDDIYAAECEACRLESLHAEAVNAERRLRLEHLAAVRRVRELVRATVERGPATAAAEPDPAKKTARKRKAVKG